MKTLRESIEINVSPEIVWDWFLHIAENYLEWHPSHIRANWETETVSEVGSILYAEEDIDGEFLKMKSKFTELIPNRLYRFKTVGTLKLILAGGSFEIEPSENGSIFTATLDFHMGKLFSKLAKKKVQQISQHMIEEGQNLKKILEKSLS
ncbi:MAG TPA: SRPBCC family protein [Candidatus Nanopelagicaceae bacterium]|nr:SRPBCC family protein [Candidatus Nanopelagicaceae bacterium]